MKSAEAGTVTYAGSEVKGYGNLVLVRHDNGYVSAYAHNGSLERKARRAGQARPGHRDVGPDRQRDLAPAPLRTPQGPGARGPDPIPGRDLIAQGDRLLWGVEEDGGRSAAILFRFGSSGAARSERLPQPSGEILDELPRRAARARPAGGRPFERLGPDPRPGRLRGRNAPNRRRPSRDTRPGCTCGSRAIARSDPTSETFSSTASPGLIAVERSFSIMSRGRRWRRFEVA